VPPQKKKSDEIARPTVSVVPAALAPTVPSVPVTVSVALSAQPLPAKDPVAILDEDVPGLWPQVVAELTRQSASFGSILAEATLSHVDGNQAVISYHSNESFFKSYGTNGKREMVARELTRLRGSPIGVRFEAAPQSAESTAASAPPSPRKASSDDALTPELLRQLQTDPLVKYVLEEFGGEIKKVEPLE
jgi:hypothetical protein